MPTTVTSSSGNVYHLWQLPDLTTPTPEEDWAFTTLENDLSDGFKSRRLLGSNTGLRRWKLKAPTLAALSIGMPTVTGIDGALVSRLEYMRSLFAEAQAGDNATFAYTSPINGQYYLVQFSGNTLALVRAKVPIYATDIELEQIRINGETVFSVLKADPTGNNLWSWYKGSGYTDGTELWSDAGYGGSTGGGSGDVDKIAAAQNGQDVVRFSNSASTGVVATSSLTSVALQEVFIVMKMREATFSNNAGIFTGKGGGDEKVLVGTSGGTKFASQGLAASAFEYRLNGVLLDQTNMQAPMNTWGVVHVRYTTGWSTMANGIQIGKERTTAGTFAKMDVGEAITNSNVMAKATAREITEYLTVKWGIT